LPTGIVFDIKRYAIHDGPGIRTTVFLKGCPLSCWWCHNPEGRDLPAQVVYLPDRCIGCGECLQACPHVALSRTDQGVVTDAGLCRQCGTCAEACPAEAREFAGSMQSVEAVMAVIEKDVLFYEESDGGATFSGGEPLMQADFLLSLLDACGRLGIHRTVDTCGYAEPEILEAVAAGTDLFLYDLKLMDDERHRHCTGVSNRTILANLEMLARLGAAVAVRIPLIPGINTDRANLERTGTFISDLSGVQAVHLLPHHRSARHKYRRLGMTCRTMDVEPPTREQLSEWAGYLQGLGLEVHIGG
jgi:pyruvate formate lyase activating enzyme